MRDIDYIKSDELKAEKRKRGISDGQIAEVVKTARQTVWGLFNGKQGSLPLLVAVCRVMGLDYRDYLIPANEENE